jgi:hypothetical protein
MICLVFSVNWTLAEVQASLHTTTAPRSRLPLPSAMARATCLAESWQAVPLKVDLALPRLLRNSRSHKVFLPICHKAHQA